jgi:hypothetical protein
VAAGDSGREAYTAIAWGVGLSHERLDDAGAESFYSLEGNMCGSSMRGADALPGSKAKPARVHPQAGWPATPARGRCAGGQDRRTGCGRAALNAIYEEEFLGISYGFRPGRSTHDALDALCVGIHSKKVSFILDADIRLFLDPFS